MKRIVIIASSLLLVLAIAFGVTILRPSPSQSAVRLTGPLTTQDVAEIQKLVLRERAALISGELAPHNLIAPASVKGKRYWRHLRERAAGELRSIETRNGEEIYVNFGDKWNSQIWYGYQLQRTTNGWKIDATGYRGPR